MLVQDLLSCRSCWNVESVADLPDDCDYQGEHQQDNLHQLWTASLEILYGLWLWKFKTVCYK